MMASTTLRSKRAQDAATVGLDPFLGKTRPTGYCQPRGCGRHVMKCQSPETYMCEGCLVGSSMKDPGGCAPTRHRQRH